MNKKILLAGALGLIAAPALAQSSNAHDGSKWDIQLNAYVEGIPVQHVTAKGLKTVTPETLIGVEVTATDADAVAAYVQNAGYEAEVINDECVVMSIPSSFIKTLAGQAEVSYISASRQFRPLMNQARVETGAEKVVTGEGLETPYTGKGVVIGVIDQGFEYKHAAFANRVARFGVSPTSGSLSKTAPNRDQLDDVGHATHVAGIAGGSKVNGSDYHGIATDAEFIMISSDFASNSVLKQTKAIKEYAEGEGKPWVLNMSFGGIIGPHDGSTSYDKNMSKLTGKGAIMVAAMGNEGETKIHAYREIADASKPVYLYIKPEAGNDHKAVISEIYSVSTDGTKPFDIRPVMVYQTKLYEPTDEQLRKAGFQFYDQIDQQNKRQRAYLNGYIGNLQTILGIPGSASNAYLLWRVSGPEGAAFHAWVDGVSYPASFATMASGSFQAKKGDNEYLVGEGAASIGKAIAVASYNNDTRFTNINGQNYSYSVGSKGGISTFSSRGPQLNDLPKPAIAAPGGVVTSAYSQYSKIFQANMSELVKKVNVNGKNYYYGVMSGTSMATPATTGIIALWLEANPNLSYDDIINIFKKTGRRNAQTGAADENGWNNAAGFGKIDAYEGLKEALLLKTGIQESLNTESPISIDKKNDAWRVLFNNDESFANIQLYSANGQLVKSDYVNAPRCGSEHVVSLSDLQPGVYLFKVATTATSITRKLIIK